MLTFIYLKEVKPENLIAEVNLEVVPRGIYQVDDRLYQYIGQPKFVMVRGKYRGQPHNLIRAELIVEEYTEPTSRGV